MAVKRFTRSSVLRIIQAELDRQPQTIKQLSASTGYSIHYLAIVMRTLHEQGKIVIAEWQRSNQQKERVWANKSEYYPRDAKFEKLTYKTTNAPYANRHKWERRGFI